MLFTSRHHAPNDSFDLPLDWDERKARLRLQFPRLTVLDLHVVDGREQELLSRIGIRLGKTFDEVRALIASI